jgi:hypothetical protein
MVLRLKNDLSIENPAHVPAEVVEKVRSLLARGASAQADARRDNFYEIENGDHTYWIHVSPISGRVVLLAAWNTPVTSMTAAHGRAA